MTEDEKKALKIEIEKYAALFFVVFFASYGALALNSYENRIGHQYPQQMVVPMMQQPPMDPGSEFFGGPQGGPPPEFQRQDQQGEFGRPQGNEMRGPQGRKDHSKKHGKGFRAPKNEMGPQAPQGPEDNAPQQGKEARFGK